MKDVSLIIGQLGTNYRYGNIKYKYLYVFFYLFRIRTLTRNMKFILFLLCLAAKQLCTIIITQTNQTIDLSLQHTLNLNNQQCKNVVVRTNTLYSLSQQGVIHNWDRNNYTQHTLAMTQSSTSHGEDMDVSVDDTNLVFLNTNGSINMYAINQSSKQMLYSAQSSYSGTVTKIPSKIQIRSNEYGFLIPLESTHDYFVAGIINQTAKNSFQLQSVNSSMYLPTNKYHVAFCQPDSKIYLYQAKTGWNLKLTLTPTVLPPHGTTQKVTFNHDSTLMTIQTDHYNPILIVNLTSYQIQHSINYSHPISMTTFIDNNSRFLLIAGNQSKHIYDLQYGLLHQIAQSLEVTDVFEVDFVDSLYVCKDSSIFFYRFEYGVYTPANQTQTQINSSSSVNDSSNSLASLNTSNSLSNESLAHQQNHTSHLEDDFDFYICLNMSLAEKAATQSLGKGIEITSQVTQNMVFAISSSPLLVYFLSFVNFINITSLYVLLNIKVQEDIYMYLKTMFINVNQDFLSLFGVQIQSSLFSEERVSQRRPHFFNITSDLVSGYASLFSIMAFYLLFMLLTSTISYFLNPNNKFKIICRRYKQGLLISQLINILIPLILPWQFFFLESGVRNIGSKINYLLYTFIIFVLVLFVFLYLGFLNKRQNLQGQTPNIIKKEISIITIKQSKSTMAFHTEILGQWMDCLSNVVNPVLILIQNPLFFLFGAGIFNIFHFMMHLKYYKNRKNGLILSLYPLLFHFSFISFYYSQDNKVLVYGTLICLSVFLLGMIHHTFTVIIQTIVFLKQLCKTLCKPTKIQPIKSQFKALHVQFRQKTIPKRKQNHLFQFKTIKNKPTENTPFKRNNHPQQNRITIHKKEDIANLSALITAHVKRRALKIKIDRTINKQKHILFN